MYRPPMASSMNQAMRDVVTRFEDEVRAFAQATVRSIIIREVERRLVALRSSVAPRRPSRGSKKRATPKRVAEPVAPPIETPVAKRDPGTKRGWTRDAIVSELASWLVSGTSVEASFITRHGPRGLVAAAKKTFGRFDAALNVASLQVSKMYPDGPPSRRSS